jgi:hypothetical protein
MAGVISESGSEVQASIAQDGYAFAHGGMMRGLLAEFGAMSDWERFADSWNRLGLDTYMADGGRYRTRRHAVYTAGPDGTIERQPHQPHYQALDYNPLNGGIERWFEPVEPAVGDGPTMQTILAFCTSLFTRLSLASRPLASLSPRAQPRIWQIQTHQFRIEARRGQPGLPSPEGVHRDGVDYVLVLLINRRNIASGITTIHALDGRTLGHFTLTDPFDAAIVDDARVAHGVTPVDPIDPRLPAYRDVLVVTFLASPRNA